MKNSHGGFIVLAIVGIILVFGIWSYSQYGNLLGTYPRWYNPIEVFNYRSCMMKYNGNPPFGSGYYMHCNPDAN